MRTMNERRSDLLDMLTYCRPAGSATENAFRTRYLLTLPDAHEDEYGNIHVLIGPEEDARILFSTHTDTVHRNEGRQTIHVDQHGYAMLSKRSRKTSNCLGADDTAGCFLMREMILAGVPGLYVFHFGEEKGGIGSFALADDYAEWLETFDYAVAFDRRGVSDVITHQAGGRCASDAFAVALSLALGGTYAPCDAGVFTDTANYTDQIPECTNISVGYAGEHTTGEVQNVPFLLALLDRCLTLDWYALPVERDPSYVEPVTRRSHWYITTSARYEWDDDNDPTLPAVRVWTDDDDTAKGESPLYLDPEWERVQRALEADDERRRRNAFSTVQADLLRRTIRKDA